MSLERPTQLSMYCRKCGYQLIGLSENRCPECGRPFSPTNLRSFSLYPRGYLLRRWTRRLAWAASVALALMLLAGVGTLWLYWGWQEEQPIRLTLDHLGRQRLPYAAIYSLRTIYYQNSRTPPSGINPVVMFDLVPQGPCLLVWLLEGRDIAPSIPDEEPLLRTAIYDGGPFHGRFGWLVERVGHLKCQDVQLSATDVINLQHLRHLESLELCGTNITDAEMIYLQRMPQLRSVNLARTLITNAGLLRLGLITNLRDLDVTDTRVTPDGIRQLKASLPNIKVQGGSQQHERPAN